MEIVVSLRDDLEGFPYLYLSYLAVEPLNISLSHDTGQ